MLNNQTILAIIPARGESKGLLKKNIKLLCGKPLIGWTIEGAKKSKYIDRIFVSTDSSEIKRIAEDYGISIPFIRPEELSTDTATTFDVIKHSIECFIEIEKKIYDLIILLQPTSPLRENDHIDKAIEMIIANKDAKGLISVSKILKSPFWIKNVSKDGYLENFFDSNLNFEQRQKQPELYSPNGAIYIYYTYTLLQENSFNIRNVIPFIMEKELSIDIDDEFDFRIAELMIKKKYE